jgi:hypothetical protein
LKLRQSSFDLVDGVDHVRARLTLDLNQHRARRVEPAGERRVFRRDDCAANVAHAHGGAVPVSDDKIVKSARGRQLVISQETEGVLTAIEHALRLIDRAVGQSGSHRLKIHALGGELRRIDLDPDRRVLRAAHTDEPDAGHLRQLLRKDAVGVITNLSQRQRVGGERDQENRRVRRIDLAIDRRVQQVRRELPGCGVDRRLNVLGRRIDRAVSAELQRDLRIAKGAAGRHLA